MWLAEVDVFNNNIVGRCIALYHVLLKRWRTDKAPAVWSGYKAVGDSYLVPCQCTCPWMVAGWPWRRWESFAVLPSLPYRCSDLVGAGYTGSLSRWTACLIYRYDGIYSVRWRDKTRPDDSANCKMINYRIGLFSGRKVWNWFASEKWY